MTNPVFDTLAGSIASIGSPDFYRQFSRYLRSCIAYDNVIVIVFQGTDTPAVLFQETHGPDVFRYLSEQYLPAAYLLDPVYHFHLNRGKPGLYRLLDVAPDQFFRSRYYKWYYGRIGITDEISVLLPVGEATTITISMGKDSSSGQLFSSAAEDGLRQHEPVIMALLDAHLKAVERPAPSTNMNRQSIIDKLRIAMRDQHALTLSTRQAEVALLILQGHSSPSIGLNLSISPQTVKVFRKQLYRRCNISSQGELFALMMPLLERAHRETKLIP